MSESKKTNTKTTDASKGIVKDEVKEQPAKKIVPKDVDVHQYISVRNGFQGRLVYKSKRTGEVTIWEEFGEPQDIELQELKNAKTANKKFFVNNWFMFDDDWIIDYLGIGQYYKNAVSIEDFDELFDKPVEELTEIINGMSTGQKRSVAYRARRLIAEDRLDSIKKIHALEGILGVELIEK